MGRSTKTRHLNLWMNGILVGTWSISPATDTLQYAPTWVAAAQGRPLSLSLPFTPNNAPLTGAVVQAYFDNMLPDSKPIRERLARRYQTGSTEAFDLLEEIGRDCVGALQLLPIGVVPEELPMVQASAMTQADIAHHLRNTVSAGPIGGIGDDDDEFRISIAGAQEKTALLYYRGQWCKPQGATPTTHILKLPLGIVGGMQYDLRDSVENEWLCAQILKAYDLPVADCEPLQFEDMKVLSVKRFDRNWWTSEAGDTLLRIPQEDMCQAKGVPPGKKYEADGGPGIDQIMGVLATSMTPEQDKRTFFQAQVLFWMLCATDGHAKNFSIFIRQGGRYQLTPLYDVLSAYPVLGTGPGLIHPSKTKMAMAVRRNNAHWKMAEIRRDHWLAVGERNGVVSPTGESAGAVLDDLVARTPAVIETLITKIPAGFPALVADSIFAGLQAAANKLRT